MRKEKKKITTAPFVVEKSVRTNTRAMMKCVGNVGMTK